MTESNIENEKGNARWLRRFVSRMPHCWDCKKILWPWQKKGADWESHRDCHRQRCRDIMREMPDMEREIRKEINDIENFYTKYG